MKKRIVQAPETTCNQHPWRGHVCSGDIAIVSDSKYRPQDLRAVNSTMQQVSSTPAAVQTSGMPHVADDEDDDDDALMELVLQTERSRGLHRRQSTDQDSTGTQTQPIKNIHMEDPLACCMTADCLPTM